MNIVSRKEWGATAWQGTMHTVPSSVRTHFLVHYHGGKPAASVGVNVPLNVEKIHLDNGWSGIGYNFLIDQEGTVYEGRGESLVGAHCPGKNRVGYGVYFAVGGDQEPSEAAKAAGRELYLYLCRKSGNKLVIGSHGDYYATSCAGVHLNKWADEGLPVSSTSVPATKATTQQKRPPKKGVSAPKFPLPKGSYFGPKSGPDESVSGYYSHRDDLRTWQKRMRNRGWDIAADGLYGPVTAGVARGFQREKGLGVDGLIGPKTWSAAWTEPIT